MEREKMTEKERLLGEQLKMVVEAVRKIVTCSRTPLWIKQPLESAVRSAKGLKDVNSIDTQAEPKKAPEPAKKLEETDPDRALGVGVKCRDLLNEEDTCLYEITAVGMVIEGVQLFDVRVLRGDKKTPKGTLMHNVPSNYLIAVADQ